MNWLEKDIIEIPYLIDGYGPWWIHSPSLKDNTFIWIVNDWVNYHHRTILENTTKRNVVIQAGGWQGVYPVALSHIFNDVFTFEPQILNFYCLTKNCTMHNIKKLQAAISDNCGIDIFEEPNETGYGRLKRPEGNIVDIPIIYNTNVIKLTIDSLNLSECDFIMLDIEGFEYEAIKGGIKTIATHKPLLCIEEVEGLNREKNTTKIEQLIYPLGYIKIGKYNQDIYYKSK